VKINTVAKNRFKGVNQRDGWTSIGIASACNRDYGRAISSSIFDAGLQLRVHACAGELLRRISGMRSLNMSVKNEGDKGGSGANR
jgi:hypothetical protein